MSNRDPWVSLVDDEGNRMKISFTDLERSLKEQQRERREVNKKRKSRTAFTNSQIFELEKR